MSLRSVNLDTNQLTDLPLLPKSQTLSEVYVSQNGLRALDGIEVAIGLQTLAARENHIVILPVSLAQLPLRTLDVSRNDINDIPAEFGLIDTLQKLLVDGNFLRKVNRGVFDGKINEVKKYLRSRLPASAQVEAKTSELSSEVHIALRNASASGVLQLKGFKIEDIPIDACSLAIHEVDASDNNISQLPEDVVAWSQSLKILNLESNKLNTFQSFLCQLTALNTLNLRKNNIRDLPPQFAQFHQLQFLDLRNNKLMYIGDEILNLQSLQTLLLGYNAINSIPSLKVLSNLRELDLSNNVISDIPEDLYEMKQLSVLNLENNNISRLPLSLGVMDSVKILMLSGNRLRSLPNDLLKKSADAIKKFLRDKIPLDSPLLNQQQEQDQKDDGVDTSLRDQIMSNIDEISAQLENLSLSNAQIFALKKKLATEKAALIREERRLQQLPK